MSEICSICRQPYDGYGNNAEPVNDGRCCDTCNTMMVIPSRIAQLSGSYTKWCRNHFDLLADGGTWIVPRSGLIFTKQGEDLVLTARDPAFPADEQQEDFERVREEFAKAGITVREVANDKT